MALLASTCSSDFLFVLRDEFLDIMTAETYAMRALRGFVTDTPSEGSMWLRGKASSVCRCLDRASIGNRDDYRHVTKLDKASFRPKRFVTRLIATEKGLRSD